MILSFIIKSPENQRSDDFQDNVPNQKKQVSTLLINIRVLYYSNSCFDGVVFCEKTLAWTVRNLSLCGSHLNDKWRVITKMSVFSSLSINNDQWWTLNWPK